MVMNGPTPIMSIMFRAVAEARPMPRTSCGLGDSALFSREITYEPWLEMQSSKNKVVILSEAKDLLFAASSKRCRWLFAND